MSYTTQNEIEALLPFAFFEQAMSDDETDGIDSGLLEALLEIVDTEIDGLITPAVQLPLATPYPQRIRSAALVLALDAVYRRRGMGDEVNPWAARAAKAREELAKIGRGELALDAVSNVVARFNNHTLIFGDT